VLTVEHLKMAARFAAHGVTFEQSARAKSDLYHDALPLLNSKRVELLEHQRLSAQLCGLERRTSRAGRDSIDHGPGGHDDIANAVCGVLVGLELDRRPALIRPDNLYGPGDSYDLENSHVLPALLRKIHAAKEAGEKQVPIWGSGRPRREFLHSDDMADACVHLMQQPAAEQKWDDSQPPLVNIGCGQDSTIAELASMIRETVGSRAEIVYDASKPDGTLPIAALLV
jgi:hypothetical protein